MLKDILESKKGFKLVCGAGNEDATEVEKLVTIYALAGCQFFDVCAKPEIVDAAKKGLANANNKNSAYLCVSVGIDGDPHITKAVIDEKKCIKCGACHSVCPHDAISDNIIIKRERCLGCSLCAKNCPMSAIKMESQPQNYKEILPELIKKGIDCIEFHAISDDESDVMAKWKEINNIYDGMLCISLDRSELGDKKLLERVKNMLKTREPYTTIIQADGIAMSGNNDELSTTLQAIATAQLFQNAKFPAYIMMSGGTNTKSTQFAKAFGVHPHCIAIGSFARKIIKEFISQEDILTNKQELEKAVKIAKSLIDISLEYLYD